MPTLNKESYDLFYANIPVIMKAYEFSGSKMMQGEEHWKIRDMLKYCYFNSQITERQLAWAKAYAKRNNITYNISSTQSVDSSTNSLSQV